jgi:LysR family transcriptional regulator (chromosome initiation inhibitor)
MLDYEGLAAVAAVVREGSFERAAVALGVTPSAISQRVRALEERVGSALVRRARPCTPTAIGAQLCAHVERVQLLEGEMIASLPALSGSADRQGPATLRVAVNADSLSTWFIEAVVSFAERNPALIDIVTDHESETAERLRAGDVLAAVTADSPQVPGCRMIELGSLRYVATASPDFMRKWFANGIDAAALAVAPVIRFDRKDQLQAQWAMKTLGVRLAAPTHWVPTTHGGMDAMVAGLGWGVNPAALEKDLIASGKLVEIVPGTAFDVPLLWQHARVGARLLDQLTKAVVASAKRALVR